MSDTFSYDALPVAIFGTPGTTSVTLLDLLEDAYGDQVSSIVSVRVAYRDAAYLQWANPDFSYWDPTSPVITRVLNNGIDIGGSGTPPAFNLTTITSAGFGNVTIAVGNNVMPNIYLQVEWAQTTGGTHFQELSVTTVPGQYNSLAAFDGTPTAAEVVAMARAVAADHAGIANANDCHWIATSIAAAVGATFDPATQMSIMQPTGATPPTFIEMQQPSMNQEGGFWRIVHRGSDNAVANWQTLVQPGDIVRMGWTGGGFHTLTVTEGLTSGMIRVVDNTDTGGTIGEHWVDYDGSRTDAASITIYRLSADQRYLTNGSAESDRILGTVWNDDIRGGDGDDIILGGRGDDVMVGGAGLDTLVGGADNDTYYLLDRSQVFVGDQLAGELYDRITEEAGGGIDTVRVSATQNTRTLEFNSSYTLPDNVEIGVVEGDRPFDLIGNDLDNKFYGNAAANRFAGGGGNDVVDYGLSEAGVDVFLAEQALNGGGALGDRFDSIEGVAGTRFRDQLNGDDSSNNLWGFGDSDILDGGGGNDGMDGGEGDDAFYVDNGTAAGGDVVIGGAGFDQVIADLVLAASGLRLNVFRDGTPITGEVNGVAYTSAAIGVEMIFGASGDDWIDASRLGTGEGLQVVAGGGHDTFVSGGGSDTFYGEAGIDTIVYSGPSSNYLVTATGRANEFTVTDRTTGVVDRINGVDALRFSDSESAATGFIATNQSFDGTAHWSESIVGGTGNDTISYANANYAIYVDLMREGGYAQALNAERWDQHVTAVENVTGSTSYINYLHGDGRDNVLIGGDNFDWLAGRGGSNTLDGRGGTDYADYYEMGGPVSIDLTVGQAVHGTGTDTLISVEQFRGTYFADTFIGDGVDNYFLGMHGNDTIRGNGGADWLEGYDGDDIIYGDQGDDRLFGGYDNDTLYGGADNDVLDGGAGNDTLSGGSGQNTLTGGLGDDVYLVDSAADTIVESAGGGSLDRVVTSVSYMLTTGAEIEALATSAPTGTAAINLTGNAFANAITGNAGANTIDGELGRDILSGLAGADTFVFDTALSPNNIDTIADFTKGDRIALDDAIFGMAGPLGQLAGSAFYAGTAAHDASDRIIYNATTGAVLYDADGTGSVAAVQFATITGQPVLHAADFWVM